MITGDQVIRGDQKRTDKSDYSEPKGTRGCSRTPQKKALKMKGDISRGDISRT